MPDPDFPINENEVRAWHESNRANLNEGALAYTMVFG